MPQGSDEAATRRFLRESRLVAGLNHPNVVTVHDFFERDGTPYIAMEYLERGALRPLMRGLDLARIAGVLEGLLAGLAHAHEHRIVHRDLKPENVMVTLNGAVKIADFGIAKATGETLMTTQLTATGTTIGTPAYMSPEQALGREIGPATDLYALGVMAFEMLAGRPPFGARDTPAAVLLRHVNEPPPALDTLDAAVDPRLSEWVGRLLEKDPGDRPPNARDAWLELEEIVIDDLGSRWRRSAPLPDVAAAPTPATLPLASRPSGARRATLSPRRRHRRCRRGSPPSGAARAARRRGRAPSRGWLARRCWWARSWRPSPPRSRAVRWRRPGTEHAGLRDRHPRARRDRRALTRPDRGAVGGGHRDAHAGRHRRARGGHSRRGAPAATPEEDASGVGDSKSDDPSDDEPDVGEP